MNSDPRQRRVRLAGDPLDIAGDPRAVSPGGTEFTGLREYLAMAQRRWILVLVVTLLALGYTLNSVRTEKPQFRARATVRLIDASRAIAGDMVGRQGSSPDMAFSGTADPIQSQIQILLSEAVATLAVDLKGLRIAPTSGEHYLAEIASAVVDDASPAKSATLTFAERTYSIQSDDEANSAPYGSQVSANGIRMNVAQKPAVASARFEVLTKEQAINDILGRFNVSGRPKTDILDLSYTGDEPVQTQRITNAMAEAYQIYNATNAQQFSKRRREFLETQLRQTDSALNAAMSAYASFRAGRQNSVASAVENNATASQIETRRIELDSERRSLEALLASARRPGQSVTTASVRGLVSSPAVEKNAAVQSLFQQLMAQESARDAMVDGGAAPTNPDLIRLNSQVNVTSGRMIDAVQSQLESVNARLGALGQARTSVAPGRPVSLPSAETREAQLQQEMQTTQKLSGDLKGELQKARMSEAVEAGQVEIVQLARYPGFQIATGAPRRLAIGLMVGLMFGFGMAVLVDGLDRSIRRRSDIEPLLGIPGLVVIPRLASAATVKGGRIRALSRGRLPASTGNENPMLDLVTVTDPSSPSAESFRTLRTNLMYSQAVEKMRTLVVTSASPGEGKTVTAANLSVAFAQQGMRVLLVDCDLRRGRLHRVFGLSREPGLSELLLGVESEENVTRETTVPGLYVIGTGKFPPNPAELLGGQHTREKLASLTEGYDLIILDTPPLLAASDAAILATLSDGVIMVLRAGSTESAAAQQSMQQLQAIGARVVGAVLNDPEAQVARYGAYYEYKYAGQAG